MVCRTPGGTEGAEALQTPQIYEKTLALKGHGFIRATSPGKSGWFQPLALRKPSKKYPQDSPRRFADNYDRLAHNHFRVFSSICWSESPASLCRTADTHKSFVFLRM
jgi:hypothetical protein